LSQAAVPTVPASDIKESLLSNLALQNLDPFQYATGGAGRGGGIRVCRSMQQQRRSSKIWRSNKPCRLPPKIKQQLFHLHPANNL